MKETLAHELVSMAADDLRRPQAEAEAFAREVGWR